MHILNMVSKFTFGNYFTAFVAPCVDTCTLDFMHSHFRFSNFFVTSFTFDYLGRIDHFNYYYYLFTYAKRHFNHSDQPHASWAATAYREPASPLSCRQKFAGDCVYRTQCVTRTCVPLIDYLFLSPHQSNL